MMAPGFDNMCIQNDKGKYNTFKKAINAVIKIKRIWSHIVEIPNAWIFR